VNIATLYNQAKTGIPKEPEVQERDLLLEQQHADWLKHPCTIELLTFLSTKELELKNSAVEGADSGWDKNKIKKQLLKAKATKEIQNYVRSNGRN
jgi:hypothetical protein